MKVTKVTHAAGSRQRLPCNSISSSRCNIKSRPSPEAVRLIEKKPRSAFYIRIQRRGCASAIHGFLLFVRLCVALLKHRVCISVGGFSPALDINFMYCIIYLMYFLKRNFFFRISPVNSFIAMYFTMYFKFTSAFAESLVLLRFVSRKVRSKLKEFFSNVSGASHVREFLLNRVFGQHPCYVMKGNVYVHGGRYNEARYRGG